MHACRLIVASVAILVSTQSIAAQPMQDNQVDLTVVRYADHVQLQCNPISLATAMGADWKKTCNQMAVSRVQELVAAGTIAAIKGPAFDTSAADPAAGPMLTRNIPLSKPGH